MNESHLMLDSLPSVLFKHIFGDQHHLYDTLSLYHGVLTSQILYYIFGQIDRNIYAEPQSCVIIANWGRSYQLLMEFLTLQVIAPASSQPWTRYLRKLFDG